MLRVKKDDQLPTVRLPSEDAQAVRRIARANGILVTDVIRQAVATFLEKHAA